MEEYYEHPNYSYYSDDYDITILKLEWELPFGTVIGPAALPVLNQEVAGGTPAVVSGWGYTEEGTMPLQLKAVEVPIVSIEDCRAAYGRQVTDRMICAGYLVEGGKDSCNVIDFG